MRNWNWRAGILIVSLACATLSAQGKSSVSRVDWGTTSAGEKVDLYTLSGRGGLVARISNFGGVIVALDVPNRQRSKTDVMLGFDDFASYERGGVYGAVIGRYANRIGSSGTFPLDGRTVQLERASPDQKVVLHSGASGFQKRVWRAEPHEGRDPSLTLTLVRSAGSCVISMVMRYILPGTETVRHQPPSWSVRSPLSWHDRTRYCPSHRPP